MIEGRFIMSLNDTPGVREVFASFKIEENNTVYMAASRFQAGRKGH